MRIMETIFKSVDSEKITFRIKSTFELNEGLKEDIESTIWNDNPKIFTGDDGISWIFDRELRANNNYSLEHVLVDFTYNEHDEVIAMCFNGKLCKNKEHAEKIDLKKREENEAFCNVVVEALGYK